ncbi:MAG: YHS domain-containing protein [Dehalococcoidia bacterium]
MTSVPVPDPAPSGRQPIATVKVHARGEDFRIVRLRGSLFVCTRQNGSCCCGWEEKGRMPFEPSLWGDEWERRRIRNRLHLTLSGCLGPCAAGNNALLLIHGHAIWFNDLNDESLVPAVFDYAEAMLAAGRVLPPPSVLSGHVYERYVSPPDDGHVSLNSDVDDGGGLDRLDPVCLMDVDPATARHTVEYEGRTITFCAPSCKRQFLTNPRAYLIA